MPGGPFFNCYPGPFSNVRCMPSLWMVFQKIQEHFSPVEHQKPDWAMTAELERVASLKKQKENEE